MSQTFRDFEWVIIDDGSSDNTNELITEFKQLSWFPIKYIYQCNRGKHTAYNVFAKNASASLYISVDSDDAILPNCLERMLFHLESIPNDEKKSYAGVMCLAQDQNGKLIGDKFIDIEMHDNLVSVLLNHRKLGDKGSLNFLSTLQEFPFPEDVERVYVPESFHIHAYSSKYRTKYINEILINPWTDTRHDHLSNSLNSPLNLKGSIYGWLAWSKFSMRFFFKNPRLYIAVTSQYISASIQLGRNLNYQFRQIDNAAGRLLWFFLIPIGFLRFIFKR
jgi:glycosyltransferase involved in cell wall biosynthesis